MASKLVVVSHFSSVKTTNQELLVIETKCLDITTHELERAEVEDVRVWLVKALISNKQQWCVTCLIAINMLTDLTIMTIKRLAREN